MEPAAKTDLLRYDFLSSELDLSLTFVRMADAEFAAGETEHAGQSLADAQKGRDTLERFLADPKHSDHLTAEQVRYLEAGLSELSAQIDRLAENGGPR